MLDGSMRQTFGDELYLVTSWQRGFTVPCWTVHCFLKANSHLSNYKFFLLFYLIGG